MPAASALHRRRVRRILSSAGPFLLSAQCRGSRVGRWSPAERSEMNEQMTWVTCPHCQGTAVATDAHGEECDCGTCQGSAVVYVPAAVAKASAARKRAA